MSEKEKIDFKDNSGFFYVKYKNRGIAKNKHPFFCPNEKCQRITSTIDDKYLDDYGICSKCYVMYVEGREKPLIDIEYYKNKLR